MVKRRQLLIEKSAQLKFVWLVLASFLVLLIFMLWNIHALLTAIVPSGILGASAERLIIFFIGTLVIIAITAAIIIKYTHRFFGPIPRLKRELDEMAESGKYHDLRVRDGDFLYKLVESINNVLEKVSGKQ